GAYKATISLLESNPNIDGIFTANDVMGVGVLRAASSLGLKVPDDLSVMGFDGLELGETTFPSLTTMAQPIYQLGKRAAALLIEKTDNPGSAIRSEEHCVQVKKRESTVRGSCHNE